MTKNLIPTSLIGALFLTCIDTSYVLLFGYEYVWNFDFFGVFLILFLVWFVVIGMVVVVCWILLKRFAQKSLLTQFLESSTVLRVLRRPSMVFVIFAFFFVFGRVLFFSTFGYKNLSLREHKWNSDQSPIFLISIDTLRGDVLGGMDTQDVHTPHIDMLMSESHVFSRAFSPSNWTLPSFASMFTGKLPTAMDISINRRTIPDARRDKVSEADVTLASTLRERGYYTQAVITNNWLIPDQGFDQGFDGFFNTDETIRYSYRDRGKKAIALRIIRKVFPDSDKYIQYLYSSILGISPHEKIARAPRVVDTSVKWLEDVGKKGTNYFLWMHFSDVHAPYEPPEELILHLHESIDYLRYLGREGTKYEPYVRFGPLQKELFKQLYLKEVEYTDGYIGQFLSYLKDNGLYEQSMIVFLSDHGEAFWEHGIDGHANNFYNEEIHVPFAVKLPNQVDGSQTDEVVGIQYLYDFIRAFSDEKIEGAEDIVGVMKKPYIISDANVLDTDRKAVITEDLFKLIYDYDIDSAELYNLNTDWDEKVDISTGYPAKTRGLTEILLEDIKQQTITFEERKMKTQEDLQFGY